MSVKKKNRFRWWAGAGSVIALASLAAYASQGGVPWLTQASGSAQSVDQVKAPVAARSGTFLHPRSQFLRSGSIAKLRQVRVRGIEKTGQTEDQVFGQHVQDKPLSVMERRPQQPPIGRWVDGTRDFGGVQRNRLERPSLLVTKTKATLLAAAAAADCTPTQFASLSGQALVNAVTAAPTT